MADKWLSIQELASQVNSGKIKAGELVKQALKNIDEAKEYNAIISVIADEARAKAKTLDEKIARGESGGRLAGVPFIAKDNFLVYGPDTTAASNILRGFKAPYQSTAINKLESEGAICVAKSNLDAFAHGASTENSDFFVTKNPHDKTRVPGGSSGGSAASVVLQLVPFALGTDTGGSIRQPASFTGCVGYKPTYGLVSRSGVVAMASSTDVIGPLARSVEDAAMVLDVIAGRDELDSTTVDRQDSYLDLKASLKGKRFGLIKEQMGEGVSEEVKAVIKRSVEKIKKGGAEVVEVSVPSVELALAVYYIICPAEVSSNLMRYDGQRYGYRYPKAGSLEESYKLSRGKGFGKEAKRRIMIGTHVLSSGYYDAYYKQAQTVRTKLISDFDAAFSKVDYLIGPVTPTVAFKIGEKAQDPLSMYLADVMTVAPDLVGNPAISLPAGNGSSGLPVGLHIMAPQRKDKELLAISKQAEAIL